jgi:hypothetical protein
MPCICNKQTKCVNVSFHSPEEYFKVSFIHVPFINNLIPQWILMYDFGVIFDGTSLGKFLATPLLIILDYTQAHLLEYISCSA